MAIVNLAIGPRTFRPSIFGKIATATYMLTAVVAMFFNYLRLSLGRRRRVRLCVAGDHADLEPALHLARGAHHRRTLSDGVKTHARWPRAREYAERLRSDFVTRDSRFCVLRRGSRSVRLQPDRVRPDATEAGRRSRRRRERSIIDLTPDAAPNQVAYFTKTAQEGGYDGTTFHRVVKIRHGAGRRSAVEGSRRSAASTAPAD